MARSSKPPRCSFCYSLGMSAPAISPPQSVEACSRALRNGRMRYADNRGEKSFRALYSTDASVYQIEPLGVVVARSRQDILSALEICRRYRCPLTLRGGGTSQGGQAIGHGIQIDTSKYYNRVLEVNAAEGWVRI